MISTWQKAIGSGLLGLMLATPLAGCAGAGRPAPRWAPPVRQPAPNATGAINPDMSAVVTSTAEGAAGRDAAEVVVFGNVALVVLNPNNPAPGGLQGQSMTGRTHTTEGQAGTPPSGGPITKQGAGANPGISVGRPGGGLQSGGASAPGGTPNSTQAAPNGSGDLVTQGGTSNAITTRPSSLGSAPMDVMTRVADLIRSKHPNIAEVRFATDPADAQRIISVARAMRRGEPSGVTSAEIQQLYAKGVTAGTTHYDPLHPSQGTYPTGAK